MSSNDDAIFRQVVCRPALPMDTPGVLALTSQIWEGDDYVPKVWREWLFDPEGLLAIAEFEGKVVGIGKLTKLSASDWWLEGLRVHPQLEGNRIASRLHKYLLEFWKKIGSGKIRFGTVSYREPVKHLAQVNGFQLAGEYSTYKSPIRNTSTNRSDPFSQTDTSDSTAVINWLCSPSEERLPFGLINLGWQFAPPLDLYLTNYLEEKQIWWWRRDQGVLIMVEKIDGLETWGRIRMLASDNKDQSEFLSDTHILAARLGFAGVTWLAPLVPNIESITAQSGFERDWESSLLIFEKSTSRQKY